MAPLKKPTKRKPTEDVPNASLRSKKPKSSTTQKEPSPDPQSSHSGGEEEEEQEIEIHGLTSDEEDSSDDEIGGPIEGIDIAKLPTVAKDDKSVQRRLDKAKRQPTEDRGVLYIGRLPHGFYEDQLKAYFSQFGEVTRLRVSRNKKTGKSKHYAFLEFDSSSVAQIVAETMDNYLLMGHILRCKVIPKEEIHPELWVGANRKWRVVPRDRVARVEQNKLRTREEQDKAAKRLIKRQNKKKKKLEGAGINYDFDAVAYVRVST
ncbi:RNA-binding domain-containing protein [Marasmius fiardii PR-910]|nr:RNA-binding domain-containing protein [Marasmius fiardii PR-910]